MELKNSSISGILKVFISLILLFVPIGSHAQAPVMEEQMVYGLALFNGKGYSRSFCPRTEDTIYIIGDSDNVLLPKMTMVYYWPLTRRYQAGFKTLNEDLEGTLEIIQAGNIVHQISCRTYTLFFAEGWYSKSSEILLDEKAKGKYADYQRVVKSHNDQIGEYYDKIEVYNKQMNEFFDKMKKGREQSNTTFEQKRRIPPEEPSMPTKPKSFVQEPREGYIVNLPAGSYEIRLVDSDGNIVEGSEKNLVSFNGSRSGKVGYEVISAKRWTMPVTSSDPAETIYLQGNIVLYIRSYIQTEFNHLCYTKLLNPQNEGNPELRQWVKIEQIKNGTLQLIKDRRVIASIEEKPYYVQQTNVPELGYNIIEYNKHSLQGRSPSLAAHKIGFKPKKACYQIELVDVSGKIIPGSRREIRIVQVGKGRELYLASAILPLMVGFAILLWRKGKLSRKQPPEVEA